MSWISLEVPPSREDVQRRAQGILQGTGLPTFPTLGTSGTLSPASDVLSEARAAGAVQYLQKPFWQGFS